MVDLALDRSRELAEARLLLTEAEEQVSEAKGEIFPSLDFSASYVRNISPPVFFMPAMIFNPAARPGEFLPLEFSADNSWQSALTLRQPLFDPRGMVGLAAAGQLPAAAHRDGPRPLPAGGDAGYACSATSCCCGGEEVALTERVAGAPAAGPSRRPAARARAGLASDYDVLRLEVELANLEPQLLLARNARDSARRRLGLELALDDPGRLRLSESAALTAESGPGLPAGDLVQTALAQPLRTCARSSRPPS